MPDSETVHSSIDSGIDRKTLKMIKMRFLQVNNARLARTKSALTPRQQIFLELLPMLFHVNHPILPGYVSHQTPCGLSGFNPTKRDVQKAQRLARSFTYRRQLHVKRDIHGIFLMGSCGTVAQSEKSDLDIWICHPSTLSTDEKHQLRQKTEGISRWALSNGLEAYFFLMEDEKFRLGERENLSSEDCGSAQHYLLLDEFYRTALLIGGRIPIWWLIPPDEEQHYDYYASNLKKKRFVHSTDTVDFGSVAHIPAGEFVGAGIWQLYKAIDSPYKSVLKILLTEVYAAEYPNIEPLSTRFKIAIYNDELDIDELDPYVVVYRKLENYLLDRGEHKRLELVRRCFYFKIGKALTRPSRTNSKSWQRQLMEKLVSQWQWPREHLYNLDARDKWKVVRVMDEQKELVRELTNSYRFVLEFARRTRVSAMINSQEMSILGRKLYAAFERKAGKIEWINPGIAPNLSEENLSFYQIDNPLLGTSSWAVSAAPLDAIEIPTEHALKRSDELISLISWCHFNGLLDSASRVAIADGTHNIGDYELHSIVRSLRQLLPVAKQYSEEGEEKHNRFEQAMRPTHLVLYINVGIDPLAHIRSQGIERLSAQTDSLGFSGLRENLVLNIEQVTINSWGELTCRRYDNEHALIRCLRDYLNTLSPGNSGALPQLTIRCFCPTRANAIATRVEELFHDIAACYYSGTRPSQSRYIINIQREYFVLQFDQEKKPIFQQNNSYQVLCDYLSNPQNHYSPIVLDRFCLQNSILQVISQISQPECIQVFYQHQGEIAKVYVLDEMGSLFEFDTPFHDEQSLLSPLDQFIQSTLFRRSSEIIEPNTDLPAEFNLHDYEVEYYEIIDSGTNPQLIRRNLVDNFNNRHFLQVQVIGDLSITNKILFSIYCDQQEFSELELGDQLYHKVAAFILSQRRSKERYPCYITDLDLSRCLDQSAVNPTQTIHYLRHKSTLEKQLNHALQSI
ncbi:MAG: class I adenylate cyclase [Spongiibacteraceae bacterium]|nr:class I adenylate cyclase [Spongiibacteraceae bacterium]